MNAIHNKTQKLSENDIKRYIVKEFEKIKRKNTIERIARFQTMNRYMIMAHDQSELEVLERIVTSYKKTRLSCMLFQYEDHLKKALEKEPTRKTHSNVIMHTFTDLSEDFSPIKREEYLSLSSQYKLEEISLKQVLAKIEPIICRADSTYLASHTYFLLYLEPRLKDLFYI